MTAPLVDKRAATGALTGLALGDALGFPTEFNDVPALERALAEGDVACVLAEPIMTNVGMVLADDGYHAALREITRRHGTLLIIDETHCMSSGPGGYTDYPALALN